MNIVEPYRGRSIFVDTHARSGLIKIKVPGHNYRLGRWANILRRRHLGLHSTSLRQMRQGTQRYLGTYRLARRGARQPMAALGQKQTLEFVYS